MPEQEKPKAYMTEFSIILASARWVAMTASDLATGLALGEPYETISQSCHVYAICRCPQFSFEPEGFQFKDDAVTGRLAWKTDGKPHSTPFRYPFELVDGAVDVRVMAYPHREFETVDAEGKSVRFVPAREIAMERSAFREFEVLYIGQAYAEGRRNAFDRLRAHATLQKILAENMYSNPDDNIFLLAFEYAPPILMTKLDGANKDAIRGPEDDARLNNLKAKLSLSEKRQICLAEAGLIRYFQPKYNQRYKESFPTGDQEILDECFDLDFSGLVVEIDTSELDFVLYSQSAKKDVHHTAKFDLVDTRKRQSFFTFVSREGEKVVYPDVIPFTQK